jgi:hypothetical protein
MKRAGIATGMVVVLLVALGGPVSAAERGRTDTAQYRGPSFEATCPTPSAGREAWDLACDGAKTAHAGVFSDRTRFRAPSWARSVRISVADDSGTPVYFRVYFNDDLANGYRFANSTCTDRATLNLRKNTKRISVARIAGGCEGTPTTGSVKAAFSSRQSKHPSPRNYISGCRLTGNPYVGFDGDSCSYTASKPGGYVGAGVWSIDIVRGNRTLHLEAVRDAHCSQPGFIRRGDQVTLRFLVGYVAAGDDVHC